MGDNSTAPTSSASTNNASPEKEGRLIKDAIHGSIELDPVLAAIIDTPQFQRLRNIKQLGTSYWVYPSASHNRFEHSIGTSYLCGKFITILKEKHPHLITDMDVLCIKIAGLCHDMGHGPFSHVFDGPYKKLIASKCKDEEKSRKIREWNHEEQSCKMFDHMIAENEMVRKVFEKKRIGEKEKQLVNDLIKGKIDGEDPSKSKDVRIKETDGKKHCFLYEIVSNARNGIDCDKFDYLMRDSYNIGWKCNFDCMRYFNLAKIVEDEENNSLHIGVRNKEQFALYELFHLRYALHHQVYQHKTTKAIEAMICDALSSVDEEMEIFKSIQDPAAFTYLTDAIIDEITRAKPEEFTKPSYDKKGGKAKQVINRIHTRNLYQICGEGTIFENSKKPKQGAKKDVNEVEDLKKFILDENKSENVTEQDFLVEEVRISYGKGNQDPVDSVIFFDKSEKISKMGKEDISNILPKHFQDRKIRVYCKSVDEKKRKLIENTFNKWFEDLKSKKEGTANEQVQRK